MCVQKKKKIMSNHVQCDYKYDIKIPFSILTIDFRPFCTRLEAFLSSSSSTKTIRSEKTLQFPRKITRKFIPVHFDTDTRYE